MIPWTFGVEFTANQTDQWDMNSLWESRYIWLPMEIDERKKTLDLVWHDVYDLNVYVTPCSCRGPC